MKDFIYLLRTMILLRISDGVEARDYGVNADKHHVHDAECCISSAGSQARWQELSDKQNCKLEELLQERSTKCKLSFYKSTYIFKNLLYLKKK